MRKIKKITATWSSSLTLVRSGSGRARPSGEYGVIDAELYTGHLEIDRSAMEYDGAETLEEAVELARGLESEEDTPTFTVTKETDSSFTEDEDRAAAYALRLGGTAQWHR